MECQTIKKGTECSFMSKRGCTYSGGACKPIVEECGPCKKKVELGAGIYCETWPDPKIKWRNGKCNHATHLRPEIITEEEDEAVKADCSKAA